VVDLEVSLRPVTESDIWKIFEWRNHPDIRMMMFDRTIFDRNSHESFWKKHLADPKKHAFIILADGEETGLLRFTEESKGVYEMGIFVVPWMQRRGIGTLALTEAKKLDPIKDAKSVIARVKPENKASLRVFEKSGFVERYVFMELSPAKPKVVAIVQARMGSSRLPGKTLADVCGKPLLWHVLFRLGQSKNVDQVVVATTNKKEDDPVAELAVKTGYQVFRGSAEDVLARYYNAAVKYGADVVVRITADCPLIDPDVVDHAISIFMEGEADYVSNSGEIQEWLTYPNGLDVEVFSIDALKRAYDEAKLLSEREHVTTYMWTNPNIFRIRHFKNKEDLSHYRWTVDEQQDLELVREIFKELGINRIHHVDEIVALMHRKPELEKINSGIHRNEGYIKSLKEDREVKEGELE
jgi:spore coat polysaccharide biosynthesis protein SpsF